MDHLRRGKKVQERNILCFSCWFKNRSGATHKLGRPSVPIAKIIACRNKHTSLQHGLEQSWVAEYVCQTLRRAELCLHCYLKIRRHRPSLKGSWAGDDLCVDNEWKWKLIFRGTQDVHHIYPLRRHLRMVLMKIRRECGQQIWESMSELFQARTLERTQGENSLLLDFDMLLDNLALLHLPQKR